MQVGNIDTLNKSYNIGNSELTDLYTGFLENVDFSKQNKRPEKQTILLMNCGQDTGQIIKSCFPNNRYDMLNAVDTNITHNTIKSVNPLLMILGIEEVNEESLEVMSSIKANPIMVNVPLVIVSETQLSPSKIDRLFAAGATDFLFNSNDTNQLKRRMKSILIQVSTINEYRRREKSVREEKERLANEFVELYDKAESRQRESLTNLELLIHTKELNETIVNKINDLTPYLNVHGKAKLKQLTRQIKWELNEEQDLNLERKLDELNHNFYKKLQSECSALTKYEMRLCAYLQSNNGSAEIARITRKTSNCINVAFARIRSKLDIENNKELKNYLNDLQGVRSDQPAYA